ncbi:hypothetical protein HDU93_004727, partial [Gonapodya sp. JEL0774]
MGTLSLPALNITAAASTLPLHFRASMTDVNNTHMALVMAEVFTKRENVSGQVLEMRGTSRVVAEAFRGLPEWAKTVVGWRADFKKPVFVEPDVLFTNTSKYQFQLISTVWNTTAPFPFPSPDPVLFTATMSFFNPFPFNIAPQGWTPVIEVSEWIRESEDDDAGATRSATSSGAPVLNAAASMARLASSTLRTVVRQGISGHAVDWASAVPLPSPSRVSVSRAVPSEGRPGVPLVRISLPTDWSVERELNGRFVVRAVTNQK